MEGATSEQIIFNMNIQKLNDLMDYTIIQIEDFYDLFKNEDPDKSTYENWNARDILGHVTWWAKFAGLNLESFKSNKIYSKADNIEELNKNIYSAFKSISIHDIHKECKESIYFLRNNIGLFNEEELLRKDYPTGFSFELWRYMDLFIFVHHIVHFLFYYLKNEYYEIFLKIINEAGNDILEYSDQNINIFLFKGYCNETIIRNRKILALKEAMNTNGIILNIKKAIITEAVTEAIKEKMQAGLII